MDSFFFKFHWTRKCYGVLLQCCKNFINLLIINTTVSATKQLRFTYYYETGKRNYSIHCITVKDSYFFCNNLEFLVGINFWATLCHLTLQQHVGKRTIMIHDHMNEWCC